MLNNQGRPTKPVEIAAPHVRKTFTGHRALAMEEALIFEVGRAEVTGVDVDDAGEFTPRLGKLERTTPIDLPGLSEPETMRHYVRLSQ